MMQWSDDVAWRTRECADGRMDVIFSRSGREAAIARVNADWNSNLDAPGQDAWLGWLERKGFVHKPLNERMVVTMGTRRIDIPCAREVSLRILAGDEATLAMLWPAFCDEAPCDTLVAHLRICAQEAVLSPLAFVVDSPPLIRRSSTPWSYPNWSAQLDLAWPLLRAYLTQVASGTGWQQATNQACRFALRPRLGAVLKFFLHGGQVFDLRSPCDAMS